MAFADPTDVQARLGRESLTTVETNQAIWLLEAATGLIAEAVDKDDEWSAALDPVPFALKALTVEITIRAMANPSGLRSISETLGSYSYSQLFAGLGIMLADEEVALVRRVINANAGRASSEPETIVDEALYGLGAASVNLDSRSLGPDDPSFWIGS